MTVRSVTAVCVARDLASNVDDFESGYKALCWDGEDGWLVILGTEAGSRHVQSMPPA